MIFQGVLLLTRVGGLIAGAYYGDVVLAVALFALGSAVCWLGFLIWIVYASGNQWEVLWNPTARAVGWSFVLVGPLALHYSLPGVPTPWLLALGMTAILIAGRYAVLLRRAW